MEQSFIVSMKMILRNLFGVCMTTEEFIEKYVLVNEKHIKLTNV